MISVYSRVGFLITDLCKYNVNSRKCLVRLCLSKARFASFSVINESTHSIYQGLPVKSVKTCSTHRCSRNTLKARTFSRKYSTAQAVGKEDLDDIPLDHIRNFSIIAHVDHGKSTLADRLLEITGAISENLGQNRQVLDKLQVERERGITVKAQTASLKYELNGIEYLLNLIDTPGHVDFANEVSRSLAACQGVILLIDANSGVQAQTVANFYLAFVKNLVIVPVLNKVDLKNADPDRVKGQLKTLFEIQEADVLSISAKLGTGVEDVLRAVVERIPPPPADRSAPFRALLFDSWYDRYKGAIALVYVTDGVVKIGDEISSIHTGKNYEVKGLGLLRPHEESTTRLFAGQVGYLVCNMRSSKEAFIGDTLHLKDKPMPPLAEFKPTQPMVFAGVYPLNQSQHVALRSAIDKLVLNDSGVTVAIDSSAALGQGWRLGFLGLLHLEVFNQRLEQEYGAQAVVTAPSVTYKVTIIGDKNIQRLGGSEIYISNPANFPGPQIVSEMFEPMVLGTIITPDTYLGPIMSLCMERRGVQTTSTNIDNQRVMMQFLLPLNEIVVDFHDSLKSVSSGYASFDYEDYGYQSSNLVKLNILLNGLEVEELSTIIHISRASVVARRMCLKLKEMIPRQMIHIAIQATVNSKVIARETLKAYRKDVTSKLYGGDVTRRMKLLKRQAEGKKKMKMIANIALPRETFIDVLKK